VVKEITGHEQKKSARMRGTKMGALGAMRITEKAPGNGNLGCLERRGERRRGSSLSTSTPPEEKLQEN